MSRQYLNAAKVVDGVINEKKSFKSVCATMKIGKTEYALAAETLKNKSLLDEVFKRSKVSADSLSVRYGLLLVMSYELLLGKQKIDSGGVVKRKLKEIQSILKSHLDQILLEKYCDDPNSNIGMNTPSSSFVSIHHQQSMKNQMKYIRVNEIKINKMNSLALVQKFCPSAHYDSHISTLLCLPDNYKGLISF